MNKRNVIITIISVLILTCLFAYARTTTTDLGLVQPTWSEDIDILDDLNANSDLLEAFANDPLEFDSDLERLEDRAGAMWTGNTETGLTITYQDADNTIDAVIGANDIVESMLKAVNAPLDEEIFTYESTTGDFEWHTLAELSIQPLDTALTNISALAYVSPSFIKLTADDTYAVRTLSEVKTDLSLVIGTDVQAYDAGLLSIAGLTTAANKSIYTTALDTYGVYDLTAFARTILDDADASAVKTTLGLVIGTNVQAYDAGLLSLAGLTYAADSFVKVTATDVYAIRTIAETQSDLSIYTNLTSFVDQTAWRLFYSNTDGDVTELALGADGTYLKSNGAAAAPTFATPAGSGTVTTSGSPVDDDYAKFTTATAIEGRSYAEMKTDLGYMTDLVDDTTPDLGGELDAGAHSIGFTQQTVSYDVTTTTVNWTLGNKATMTFGAGNIGTFAFTNPTNPCNVVLKIVQDGTGSRVVTAWDADIKWAGGSAPTLSTGANAIDIISFYWDGTNYFGVASLNFS